MCGRDDGKICEVDSVGQAGQREPEGADGSYRHL